jgi:hypothetical protein
MKPLASADIETDPFKFGRKLRAFLAGWYDGKVIRKFWGPDCLKKCYRSMRHFRGYIYLHNGGKYDLHHFLRVIPPKDIIPDGNPPIHGRIASLSIIDGPTFVDSYLILPVPLAAHGKEEIDYRIFEEDKREIPANKKRIHAYFDTDLISLYDFVSEFVGEYGHGLTLAGRAFAAGKKLLDIKKFPQTNEFYDRKYRRFYYGGRVECFALGAVPFGSRYYDLNSAYPHAMLSRHAWGGRFEVRSKEPGRNFEQSFFHVSGIAHGCFPVRTPEGLSYPHRRGEWHLTGWEYRAGLETGAFEPLKLIAVHVPECTRDFGEYVHHFYRLKAEAATPTEKLFAKLMLNSFYGRFALNPREHKETLWLPYGDTPGGFFDDKEDATGWEIDRIWADCDLVLWSRPKPPEKWRFYDVALAASIAGFVRANLWRSLCAVTRPFYCDTDAIICADGAALPLGDGLGQWKLEAEAAPGNLWIAGKKLYAMRTRGGVWKTAAKGVRLTGAQIRSVALGRVLEAASPAPTYSLYREDGYTRRTVRRAVAPAKLRGEHEEETTIATRTNAPLARTSPAARGMA